MATILHIDASPRGERSFSRNLTKEFVNTCSGAEARSNSLAAASAAVQNTVVA